MDRLKKFGKDHKDEILIFTNAALVGAVITFAVRRKLDMRGMVATTITISDRLEDGTHIAMVGFRNGAEQWMKMSTPTPVTISKAA